MKIPSVEKTHFGEQWKRADRWRWIALILVSMAIFLDTVDVSIVNVALPSIKLALQLTTVQIQWVPGVYGLTYAGFMLLGGRAADLLGRRRIFLLGATLFGLASLVGGLAPNGWLLILARGVQGIGAALTMPAATSIITTTWAPGPERNKALGIFSATGGAGFTCGLALGGVLTNYLSWHWVFFINVPFVLLILLLSPLVVPEGKNDSGTRSYDLAGAITVTGGLLLLVYAITQTNDGATTPLKTTGLLALALLLLGAFLFIERQTKEPLMPLRILRSSNLGAVCVVSFALLGSFFGFLFIYTLYLQNVLHFSPLDASFALLPASIACIPASQFVAPWFMNRLGIKLTTGVGMLCLLSGIALFLRTGVTSDYMGTILPTTLLVLPFGMSLCVPTLAAAAVSGIGQTEQGLAAGLQGTSGQAGGGLLLALTAAAVTVSTTSAQTSVSSVAAQLRGFHAGLLVVAAGAALGALVALVGIRSGSPTPLDAPHEGIRYACRFMVRHRTLWIASAADCWALLFAGAHFYWALGGSAGFAAASGDPALQHQRWFVVLGLWGVGALCVLAGGLVFMLLLPRIWIIPRWMVLTVVWVAGVVFALRGGLVEIQDLLVVTHLVAFPVLVSGQVIAWRLVLWSPWFLLGGLLFCSTAWWARRPEKEAVVHHDDE